MAQMCPSDVTFEIGRKGEEFVFALLRDALPDSSWWVFYNIRFHTDAVGTKVREIDFVVVNPGKGCLFLEVKGGEYVHDPVLGWCRKYKGSLEPDNQHGGPYAQINSAAHALIEASGRVLGFDPKRPPFRWGTGVVFPFSSLVRVDGVLPPNADGSVTAEEGACETPDRFRAWLLKRFRDLESTFPGSERQSKEATERLIHRFLAPRVESLSRLASQIARSKLLEEMLTAEQRIVCRLLADRRRVLISGYAGTGKTFMAVYRAVSAWDASTATGITPRIGIVCFNRNLARFIRTQMLPAATGIEVFHFHGLCDQLGREAGLPPVPLRDQQFLESGCVDRLLQAWDSGRVRPFDVLIVDEGQDFRGNWIETLEECFVSASGSVVVLYDPLQDIYHAGQRLAERFGAPYPVRTNCRNSLEIATAVRATRPRELSELLCPPITQPGIPVEVITYRDEREQLGYIGRLVTRLIDEHGLKPRQIALLSPFQRPRTCLASVQEIGRYRLAEFDRHDEVSARDVLFFETVFSFKGLDSDAVILHDLRQDGWGSKPEDLYVAFSRARFGLFVLRQAGLRLPPEVEELVASRTGAAGGQTTQAQ